MADRDQEARASDQFPADESLQEASEVNQDTLWAMLQGARSERDQQKESADQYLNLLQRIQADFLNYKRRVEGEQDAKAEAVRAETIRAFLPIVDDLERALSHLPAEATRQPWAEGLKLIERNLAAAFERLGVQRVGAEGEQFDPNLHEAVAYEEHPTHPEGHIAAVYRSGYRLGERVVRPAQVTVARAVASQQGSNPGDWQDHAAGPRHGNGGAGKADLHGPRHIERA